MTDAIIVSLLEDPLLCAIYRYIMVLDYVHIGLAVVSRAGSKGSIFSFLLVRGSWSFSWIASWFHRCRGLRQVSHHLYHLRIFNRSLWSFIRIITLFSCTLCQRFFVHLLFDFELLVCELHSSVYAAVWALGVAPSHGWRRTSLPNRWFFWPSLLFKNLHFFLKLLLRLIVIDIALCCIHTESRLLLCMIDHDLGLLIVQRRNIQGIGTDSGVIYVAVVHTSIGRVDGLTTAQGFIYWLWP